MVHLYKFCGLTLIGAAGFALSLPPGSKEVEVPMASEHLVHRLDGYGHEVYGTGLGGLYLSSKASDNSAAVVSIRHLPTGKVIDCGIVVEPQGDAASQFSVDCSAQDGGEMESRQKAARKMLEPVAREYVLAIAEQRPYDTAPVVDAMLHGMNRAPLLP
ncbi:hypothetical protein [Qipengyuania sphaerica]|uniref:hypothetical protein n=1 Tax=Qipengyuania sphaerica TaxID=2867243 RepID=UPI001C870355|nr:hypothetical protein [Qipengyuania sphaerica]MBX7540691.1 hypothetical protein [Qipengyuania sphaerica]